MDIITANELISGATVYYLGKDNWGPDIDQARVFTKEEAQLRDETIRRGDASGRLISVAWERVEVTGGRVLAKRLRERIRAGGPTSPAQLPQLAGASPTGIFRHVSL